MKVYLAGPMTYGGRERITDHVRSQFTLAASRVRGAGDTPVNPLDWAEEHQSWADNMKRSVKELLDCDAIYLLSGWQDSKGASQEARIAAELGLWLWTQDGGAFVPGDILDGKKMDSECVPPPSLSWPHRASDPSAPSWTLFDPSGEPGAQPAAVQELGPVPLPFLRVGEGPVELPTRAYEDDAGMDLYCASDAHVRPGTFVDVPCGVAVELPLGVWALVIGRSSTLRRRGLMVNPGVIDTGYRGEMLAGVWNLGQTTVHIERGERLAQLILFSNTTRFYTPAFVERLSESPRGTSGFGSSGQ